MKCSLDQLIERDPKGLYAKALAGEIENFTGVSDPYEEPVSPEIVVETDMESVEESAAKIISRLECLGVPGAGDPTAWRRPDGRRGSARGDQAFAAAIGGS